MPSFISLSDDEEEDSIRRKVKQPEQPQVENSTDIRRAEIHKRTDVYMSIPEYSVKGNEVFNYERKFPEDKQYEKLGPSARVYRAYLEEWGRKRESFEAKGPEQRVSLRLGEICVFNPDQTSLIIGLLTMYRLRTHLPWFSASTGDLSTLAMLSYPVSKRHAGRIWKAAKRDGDVTCAYERLVLGSVDVDEAVSGLKAAGTKAERHRYTPIGVVACTLVLERTKAHLESMFVESVIPATLEAASESNKEGDFRGITIGAARSLEGNMAELGDVFEKVWLGGGRLEGVWVDEDEDEDDEEKDGVEHDKSLMRGIMLYKKLFPSAVMGGMRG